MSARNGWNVTFETVTEESARYGDAAERGFLARNLSFREAVTLFDNEREWHNPPEADCDLRYPLVLGNRPRWFTDYGMLGTSYGETRNVTLHLPDSVTQSSAYRIARLIGAYGS